MQRFRKAEVRRQRLVGVASQKWFEQNLGLFCCDGMMRSARDSSDVVEDRQAIVVDPEVVIRTIKNWKRKPHPKFEAVELGAISLWFSNVRFAHIQRSYLINIMNQIVSCVCVRGKGTPGFLWDFLE